VDALPTYRPASFTVSWSGYDNISGVADYDLQVCQGECPSPQQSTWTDWLTQTTQTSYPFNGQHAQAYYFRSRARDNAGNEEPYPDVGDAWTIVDANPPSTTVEPMALYTTSTSFPVRWHGSDDLSGLDHYDLYYRDESAADWTLWLEGTTAISATFLGTPGHTYHFCSRGVDQVGNQENCPPACVEGDQCGWPIVSDAHIAVAPGSRVNDLPPYTGSRTFTVSWGGSSGVEGYDVQVCDGLYGAWQTWKNNVSDTSAQYTGQWGHTYYFRSRARQGRTWEVYPYDYDTFTKLVQPGLGGAGQPAPLAVVPPDEAPDHMEEVTRTEALGTPLIGFIAPEGDVDWYRFQLTETLRLRVTLADLPADFDLYVFDGSGQFRWASTWGHRLPEEVVVRVPAGVYYVRLAGYAGAWDGEGTYRLLVERAKSGE
jgi:hypothetical protein